jgi:hypothetical protein
MRRASASQSRSRRRLRRAGALGQAVLPAALLTMGTLALASCGPEQDARGYAEATPAGPFPTPAGIAAARSYLAGRAGRTAFAVLDSAGRLTGMNTRERFETASIVKVMFLTAYLQMLAARDRPLSAVDRALLYPMIHESNNDDASQVLSIVGAEAVARVAREAGMRDYSPGIGWWAYTQTSAADQARFAGRLDRLIPARFYGYARHLLSTIEPEQSWGFPPVARPRWQVYFKTGALPSQGLFTEVARLERGPVRFSAAVLTDGQPSQAYGEETIAGVAARLLAGPVDQLVHERPHDQRFGGGAAPAAPHGQRPDGVGGGDGEHDVGDPLRAQLPAPGSR